MSEIPIAYWLGVASLDHVKNGVQGGFCQFSHGKRSGVEALNPGDWIVYYSPRARIDGSERIQSFTAIGTITADEITPARRGNNMHYRRAVCYRKDAVNAGVRELLPDLSFVKDKKRWGIAFRTSKRRLSKADFTLIARAMKVKP